VNIFLCILYAVLTIFFFFTFLKVRNIEPKRNGMFVGIATVGFLSLTIKYLANIFDSGF